MKGMKGMKGMKDAEGIEASVREDSTSTASD